MNTATRSADRPACRLIPLSLCLLAVLSTPAEQRGQSQQLSQLQPQIPQQQQEQSVPGQLQSQQPPNPLPAGIKNLFWQPNDLQQGSPAFFTIEFERVPTRVSAKWIDKDLTFFKSPTSKIWFALAGDDLETQPGSYDLVVTARIPGHKIVRAARKIDIAAGNFPSGAVNVPENFVEPDAAGKKQIAADQVLKNRAFANMIPVPQWSGNFVTPVDAKPTNSFGMNRVFNEELSSTHRGTDFPMKEGTPVVVSNSGTVVLAKQLFYEGKCVIVDYGLRFFTIYMHLSRIDVKPDERLKKGAKNGLSGATGRVTGPHVHMGVRWNGAYLDPTRLIALTLPQVGIRKRGARKSHHHK
jgi:murein DD-endopeptidase MepM/ murein hydrolase activator NlpD